jgi:hypothetical protein
VVEKRTQEQRAIPTVGGKLKKNKKIMCPYLLNFFDASANVCYRKVTTLDSDRSEWRGRMIHCVGDRIDEIRWYMASMC